jgi:hypothetical protein
MAEPMHHSAKRYRTAVEQAYVGTAIPCVLRLQLTLFADRLSLSGWFWRGRYLRAITLDTIAEVAAVASDRLDIQLTSGEILSLTVPGPERWQRSILAHRDVLIKDHAP